MKTLLALLLLAGVALAGEVKLEAKWTAADRSDVTEESLIDAKAKATVKGAWGDPTGKTSGTGKFIERKSREYAEEVVEVSEGHVKLTRTYSSSLKESLKPSGAKKTSERTALFGRVITIVREGAAQGVTSDLGEVTGDDAGDATFVDQIYALLPSGPVQVGKGWDVDPAALGHAIFHEGYNPALMHLKGKAVLRDVSGKEGDRVARIALDWSLKLDKVEKSPGIEYRLTGVATFHVDRGRFLALEVEGPISLDMSDGENRMELEGKMSLSYRGKPAK